MIRRITVIAVFAAAFVVGLCYARTSGVCESWAVRDYKAHLAVVRRQQDMKAADHSCAMSEAQGIAIAFTMYTQDHGGRLPKHEGWGAAIRPYVHPRCIRLIPMFEYNPALSGKLIDSLASPCDSVLIKRKTALRDGKLIYAFADGHTEVVEPTGRRAFGGEMVPLSLNMPQKR